jgi:hypothetical protein
VRASERGERERSFYLEAMSSDEQRAREREGERGGIKPKKERDLRKVDDNMTSVGIDECKGGWLSPDLLN